MILELEDTTFNNFSNITKLNFIRYIKLNKNLNLINLNRKLSLFHEQGCAIENPN